VTVVDRARLAEEVIRLVRAAHDAILHVYARPVEARLKEDQSPLTEADLASHRILSDGLSQLLPQLPIVSEEGRLADTAVRASWPAYWLIDPLDGTKEFLARNDEFTVNVALVETHRATLGVVGVPARDQLFVGDVTRGVAQRLEGDRVQDVRARPYAGDHPTVVASRRHGAKKLQRALIALEESEGHPQLRSVGSALKLCLLAEGQADLYPRLAPTAEWDTAAAQAVLEAAGGAVFQLNGLPLTYNKPDILNPNFVAVADARFDWLQFFK
jgi:3'(2'), 5'-bisphosphate nucleotidase